jgi:AraC family transcriptional regulator
MLDTDFLSFRSLYDSPMIHVREYICRDVSHEHSGEEQADANTITLLRHGAFTRHFGRRSVTADVNQATFFAKDSVYRVSHPGDCGDRGTSFEVAQPILNDIIRELDPAVDERPDHPFRLDSAPCDAKIFWRHREYVQRLERKTVAPLEPLWADVTGLQLMADVLESAFAHSGAKPKKRAATVEDHTERTEAAKTYMAARIGENITLDEIAASVYSSPFNFARIFQQQTGMPIHRYLLRLRLRASLERIAEPHADLTSVALDLGFSSHSHFTDVFRREFGKTPSEFRQNASVKMSKNLIA